MVWTAMEDFVKLDCPTSADGVLVVTALLTVEIGMMGVPHATLLLESETPDS